MRWTIERIRELLRSGDYVVEWDTVLPDDIPGYWDAVRDQARAEKAEEAA